MPALPVDLVPQPVQFLLAAIGAFTVLRWFLRECAAVIADGWDYVLQADRAIWRFRQERMRRAFPKPTKNPKQNDAVPRWPAISGNSKDLTSSSPSG